MRAKGKANLVARIINGSARCDCDAPATRIDEAGRPECQRCHDLNKMAMMFHDRQRMDGQWIIWKNLEA